MKFVISGNIYEIKRDHILQATQGIPANPPDKRNKYYVEIRGERYPIKQLIGLVTGLSNGTFNADPARRVLEKLHFSIRRYEDDEVQPAIETEPRNTANFAVILEKDEDGFFVASVPALPGCHSQGRTSESAISNVREAIRGYIASMQKHGEKIPTGIEVRQVEIAV